MKKPRCFADIDKVTCDALIRKECNDCRFYKPYDRAQKYDKINDLFRCDACQCLEKVYRCRHHVYDKSKTGEMICADCEETEKMGKG